MFRRSYFLVKKAIFGLKKWDIVKGHWTYAAPFHPTDMTKTYVLGGYAIGYKALKEYLKDGTLVRITKREAIDTLLRDLR